MNSPSMPPPFDRIAERPFSFFPAIIGFQHNEWQLREASWSEILVVNDKTHEELWIPRRYVGEVSPVEDPVVIVGLNRELEFKGGMLVPFKNRLLKMPTGFGMDSGPDSTSAVEPPRGLGLRMDRSDKQAVRLVGIAIGAVALLGLLFLVGAQVNRIRQAAGKSTAKDADFQALSRHDDRFRVLQKLGNPGVDRSKETGTIFFEALSYPERGYTIILTGTDAKTVTYIGTVDDHWKTIHAVTEYHRDQLKTLPPF